MMSAFQPIATEQRTQFYVGLVPKADIETNGSLGTAGHLCRDALVMICAENYLQRGDWGAIELAEKPAGKAASCDPGSGRCWVQPPYGGRRGRHACPTQGPQKGTRRSENPRAQRPDRQNDRRWNAHRICEC